MEQFPVGVGKVLSAKRWLDLRSIRHTYLQRTILLAFGSCMFLVLLPDLRIVICRTCVFNKSTCHKLNTCCSMFILEGSKAPSESFFFTCGSNSLIFMPKPPVCVIIYIITGRMTLVKAHIIAGIGVMSGYKSRTRHNWHEFCACSPKILRASFHRRFS